MSSEAAPKCNKLTLSPAERSRRFRQMGRFGTYTCRIRIDDAKIEWLVNRGYLRPSERDDLSAVGQAISLFVGDTARKLPKRAAEKQPRRSTAKRLRSASEQ